MRIVKYYCSRIPIRAAVTQSADTGAAAPEQRPYLTAEFRNRGFAIRTRDGGDMFRLRPVKPRDEFRVTAARIGIREQ